MLTTPPTISARVLSAARAASRAAWGVITGSTASSTERSGGVAAIFFLPSNRGPRPRLSLTHASCGASPRSRRCIRKRAAMGKHGTGYARVGRDHYPTPYWVIAALAEWLELRGLTVWEPACGDGGMAAALRQQSCARVHTSDLANYGNGQDETLDFLPHAIRSWSASMRSSRTRPSARAARWRPRSSGPGSNASGRAGCSRYCCRPISIVPRRGRGTSPITRGLPPRSR